MVKPQYELVESTLNYHGILVDVTTDQVNYPNGHTYTREKIHHCKGVCILALNPDHSFYVVNQYRHGVNQMVWELPAGKADHPDQTLLQAAKRELEEECGVIAEHWIDMGEFIPSGAYLSETIQCYLAYGLTQTHTHFDDDEFIEIDTWTMDDAITHIMDNTITDGKTIALILKVNQWLNQYTNQKVMKSK